MEHFLDSAETIPAGLGFSHFDWLHLTWLLVFIVFTGSMRILYGKANPSRRKTIRILFAAALIAEEIFKDACLVAGQNFMWKYLPLHLCSINIFLIAWHAWHPENRWISAFLYTVCIPGALAALLFPDWTAMPFWNWNHLQSFTIHILLAAYPIMLWQNKEIVPDIRQLPGCLILLGLCGLLGFVVNACLGTNFMFLSYAEPGNPLYLFEELFGSHLYGFPILIVLVMLLMYGPLYAWRYWKKPSPMAESAS